MPSGVSFRGDRSKESHYDRMWRKSDEEWHRQFGYWSNEFVSACEFNGGLLNQTP